MKVQSFCQLDTAVVQERLLNSWMLKSALTGGTHYNMANQGTLPPCKHGLGKRHFYEWIAVCGSLLLVTLCGNLLLRQQNEEQSLWSGSGICWRRCVRASAHRGYSLRAQVGTSASLGKVLTLQVRSSAPGSQGYSCHTYICTVGSHICIGVSSNITDRAVAGQARSICCQLLRNLLARAAISDEPKGVRYIFSKWCNAAPPVAARALWLTYWFHILHAVPASSMVWKLQRHRQDF